MKKADHVCLNHSENDFTEGTPEQEQMDCQEYKRAAIDTGVQTEIGKAENRQKISNRACARVGQWDHGKQDGKVN